MSIGTNSTITARAEIIPSRSGHMRARARAGGRGALIVAVAALAGELASRSGSLLSYGLLGLSALAVATLVLAADALFPTLVLWVASEGLAYPFLRYPLHHDRVTYDRVMVLGLGMALLFSSRRQLGREYRRLLCAFGAFTVIYGLRALLTHKLPTPVFQGVSNSLQPGADWLDHVALPFVLFAVAARTMTRSRWETMAKALTVLGVTLAGLAILEALFGFEVASLSGQTPFLDPLAHTIRPSGPYSDPANYGSVLITCIAATLYWMQTTRTYRLAVPALVTEVVGLAPSLTRTIWGTGVVTIAICLGLGTRYSLRAALAELWGAVRRLTVRTAVIVLSVLTVGAAVYSFVQSSSVLTERVSSSEAQVSATGRLGAYAQGLLIFERWPLTGAGIDQFVPAQPFVKYVEVAGTPPAHGAHDLFINVLAETGLVGFVPLLFLVYAIGRMIGVSRRRRETEEEIVFGASVFGASVGYLLVALVFNLLYQPQAAMLLAVVLGAAAARLPTSSTGLPASEPRPGAIIRRRLRLG